MRAQECLVSQQCGSEIRVNTDQGGRTVLIPQPKLPVPYSQMRNDRGWYGIILRDLGFRVYHDVVRCSHHIGGIDPHHSGCEVGASGPALHGHRLVQRPQQPPKIPEKTLFGVPLGANL